MSFWELFNDLASELYDVVISTETCVCHGYAAQIDGFLSPGVPIRILAYEVTQMYHLSIGFIPDVPPPPITGKALIEEIENYHVSLRL